MTSRLGRIVEEIPWDKLQDAFGSAEAIRELIFQAASPSNPQAAESALGKIYGRICYQDVLELSAPLIVPAIIELLNVEDLQIADFVLVVLFSLIWPYLAEAGFPGVLPIRRDFEPKNLANQSEVLRDETYRKILRDTYSSVQEGLETYLVCLAHRNPAVRANAAHLLAFLTPERRIGPELERAYGLETNVLAQASDTLGLGILTRDIPNVEARSIFQGALEATPPVLKFCGAVAQVYATSDVVSESIWATLEEAAQASRIRDPEFPWSQGAIAGLAAEALTILARGGRQRAIDSLLRAVKFQCGDNGTEAGDNVRLEWPLPWLVAEHLILLALDNFKGRTHEVLREELSADQIRVLSIVGMDCGIVAWAQRYCGIPLPRRDLPRYLGLSPAGPLDCKLTLPFGSELEYWPVWKWWRLQARGHIEESEFIAGILEQLDSKAVFQLCEDMATGAYNPSMVSTNDVPVSLAMELVDKLGPLAIEPARAYADRLIGMDVTISQAALAMAPLLRQARDHDEPIDARYRKLIELLTGSRRRLGKQLDRLLP